MRKLERIVKNLKKSKTVGGFPFSVKKVIFNLNDEPVSILGSIEKDSKNIDVSWNCIGIVNEMIPGIDMTKNRVAPIDFDLIISRDLNLSSDEKSQT